MTLNEIFIYIYIYIYIYKQFTKIKKINRKTSETEKYRSKIKIRCAPKG